MTLFPINLNDKSKGGRVTTFLRAINEAHQRQDFLENYTEQTPWLLSPHDVKFMDLLKTPSIEKENMSITNVVEIKYRMTIFFEQNLPKVNIILAWLLLFLGSLEYQLNPNLFTDQSCHTAHKVLSYKNYSSPQYYEA